MSRWFTVPFRRSASAVSNSRGFGSILFALLFLIPFFTFSFFIVEHAQLRLMHGIADDAVVMSALAALKGTYSYGADFAYEDISIDPSDAYSTFREYLSKNMKLDGSLNPLPGSIAVSPVEILDFRVYNPGSYPAFCPGGVYINAPSIHVVISFQVDRPVLRGLFGERVTMKVHRDVDIFCRF